MGLWAHKLAKQTNKQLWDCEHPNWLNKQTNNPVPDTSVHRYNRLGKGKGERIWFGIRVCLRYNRAGIKPRLGEEGGKGFGLAYAYVKPKQLSAARTPSCGSYCTLLIHLPFFRRKLADYNGFTRESSVASSKWDISSQKVQQIDKPSCQIRLGTFQPKGLWNISLCSL